MKQQLKRLEENSQGVRAVIDSMGEGLIAIDEDGLITAINPYALNALGFKESELLGKWFSGTVVAVDQQKRPIPPMERAVVRALTMGETVTEEMYYLRKDGSMIPVFLSVAPIMIDGRPKGAIELFRDITSEKQLEIAKEEFVSLASHQLRTPASGVKAILSMLQKGDFGEMTEIQRRYLHKAIQGNDRQLQIIEDILNTARIDAGGMELQVEEVDLRQLTSEAVGEHIRQFELRSQTHVLKEVPPVTIHADGSKLRMVLDNLLSNASKYTQPGGQVHIEVIPDSTQVRICVSDTGVGIDQADVGRLFTKFTRIDNELSMKVGGSGLGLYLANNIVKMHHGKIDVQSLKGVGSRFSVILPLNQRAS